MTQLIRRLASRVHSLIAAAASASVASIRRTLQIDRPVDPHRAVAPVFVEPVERRQLLSSITMSGGLLTINGDANTTRLAVDYSNNVITARTDHLKQTYSKSAISKIRINGGSRSELISVTSQLTIPATIYGNGGNDTVWSGNGSDVIYGGDGNDQLFGRSGNDQLYGDAGNDKLDGGIGTDESSGGTGTNTNASIEGAIGSSGAGTGSTGGSTGTTPTTPATGGTGAPVAVITALSTTVAQNQAIHVNAVTSSVLNSGTAITARYTWDFGDPNSKYNKLEGFNAAHVYDTPGTYTIKLSITNQAGRTGVATKNVTITAANRRKIYVSSAGSDSNNGSSTSLAVRTIARASALMNNGSNVEILFRRGDRFAIVDSLVPHGDNVYLGAYGTGDRPVIEGSGYGKGFSMFSIWGRDTAIQGLAFNDPKGIADGINPHSINTVIRDCQFQNIGTGINCNGNPTGLIVQDCSESLVNGLRGYLVWSQGTDHVYLGNVVPNSVDAHDIRSGGTDRLLVAYNTLTNLDRRSVDPADYDRQALTLHTGNYAWVAHNTFDGGRCEFGPLGGADGVKEANYQSLRERWVVIEANVFHDSVDVDHGTEHIVFRNNILDKSNWAQIKVDGFSATYNRGVVDLNVFNNTSTNSGNADNFLKVTGAVSGINVLNNIYLAPNMATGANTAAPVFVSDSSLKSFNTISNNVWYVGKQLLYAEGGVNYVWPMWSNRAGYQTPAEWNALPQVGTDLFSKTTIGSDYAPLAGSSAIGAGVQAPGVFVDFYGRARPTSGAITIGAVQV